MLSESLTLPRCMMSEILYNEVIRVQWFVGLWYVVTYLSFGYLLQTIGFKITEQL